MARHQVPRWMSALWVVLVIGIASSYLAVALRRGYDLTLTVGFLAANFVDMFMWAVLAGLLLYVMSLFLRPRHPRKVT